MASVLPIVLVENSEEIYTEVANYVVIPPERIVKFWRIYTTAWRKTNDPRAHRQEYFWWHVMGSDMKFWPGARLAKLMKEFATTPTITPLCPPDTGKRDGKEAILPSGTGDEPSKPPCVEDQVPQSLSPKGNAEEPVAPRDSKGSITTSNAQKLATRNGVKGPPPRGRQRPSCMKKTRGASGSSTRPTARFADPPPKAHSDSPVVFVVELPLEQTPPSMSPPASVEVVAPAPAVTETLQSPLPSPARGDKVTALGRKVSKARAKIRPKMPPRKGSSQLGGGPSTTKGPKQKPSAESAEQAKPSSQDNMGTQTLEPSEPASNTTAAGKQTEKTRAKKSHAPQSSHGSSNAGNTQQLAPDEELALAPAQQKERALISNKQQYAAPHTTTERQSLSEQTSRPAQPSQRSAIDDQQRTLQESTVTRQQRLPQQLKLEQLKLKQRKQPVEQQKLPQKQQPQQKLVENAQISQGEAVEKEQPPQQMFQLQRPAQARVLVQETIYEEQQPPVQQRLVHPQKVVHQEALPQRPSRPWFAAPILPPPLPPPPAAPSVEDTSLFNVFNPLQRDFRGKQLTARYPHSQKDGSLRQDEEKKPKQAAADSPQGVLPPKNIMVRKPKSNNEPQSPLNTGQNQPASRNPTPPPLPLVKALPIAVLSTETANGQFDLKPDSANLNPLAPRIKEANDLPDSLMDRVRPRIPKILEPMFTPSPVPAGGQKAPLCGGSKGRLTLVLEREKVSKGVLTLDECPFMERWHRPKKNKRV